MAQVREVLLEDVERGGQVARGADLDRRNLLSRVDRGLKRVPELPRTVVEAETLVYR
jgi:hypothetical protein